MNPEEKVTEENLLESIKCSYPPCNNEVEEPGNLCRRCEFKVDSNRKEWTLEIPIIYIWIFIILTIIGIKYGPSVGRYLMNGGY